MSENLGTYRKSYEKNYLDLKGSYESPFDQFREWFKNVEEVGGIEEVNAMTLSTIGLDGYPKSRIVLLKGYDKKGFTFYTNYKSEKGKALEQDPHVCLSFFWPNVERQVIIKGVAKKVSELQSSTYFHSRPKGSQLGALASPQSEVIPNRDFLEEKLSFLTEKYQDIEIPKPAEWGGFLVMPKEFEFWQGRPNRLHDRIRYSPDKDLWKRDRLAP